MTHFNFYLVPVEKVTPCSPNPCGINAACKERDGVGSCQCLPDFHGDPYTGCRPECVQNSDCDRRRACLNQRCVDPCIGACTSNAECTVLNHSPICSCVTGFTGDPFSNCYPIPQGK